MHTSTRLAATDFHYGQRTSAGTVPCTFADFCPNYHELDRVGIVSPRLEDGVLLVGRTLLALTTAFYDCHRGRAGDFFDYPQHFAFVGATEAGVQTASAAATNTPELWAAWSWLDVWPNHKWITVPPTATGMLQTVFDFQINRLFWPRHLLPAGGEEPLPGYAYRMLRTRLKSVYYYALATEEPSSVSTVEVRVSGAAQQLWQESTATLPASVHCHPTDSPALTALDCLQPIAIDEFLYSLAAPDTVDD